MEDHNIDILGELHRKAAKEPPAGHECSAHSASQSQVRFVENMPTQARVICGALANIRAQTAREIANIAFWGTGLSTRAKLENDRIFVE